MELKLSYKIDDSNDVLTAIVRFNKHSLIIDNDYYNITELLDYDNNTVGFVNLWDLDIYYRNNQDFFDSPNGIAVYGECYQKNATVDKRVYAGKYFSFTTITEFGESSNDNKVYIRISNEAQYNGTEPPDEFYTKKLDSGGYRANFNLFGIFSDYTGRKYTHWIPGARKITFVKSDNVPDEDDLYTYLKDFQKEIYTHSTLISNDPPRVLVQDFDDNLYINRYIKVALSPAFLINAMDYDELGPVMSSTPEAPPLRSA